MASARTSSSSARSCGSEVSPYITECPYCGTRLRKRAPKIERDGTLSEPRTATRPARRPKAPRLAPDASGRDPGDPGRCAAPSLRDRGARGRCRSSGTCCSRSPAAATSRWPAPSTGEWWRLATTPFLYGNVWYELAAVTSIAIFGTLLERRHGPLVVVVLFFLGGAGGAALEVAVNGDSALAVGGNGAALALLTAWAVPDLLRRRRGEDVDADLLGVAVIAVLLLALPAAAAEASVVAGLAGALAGSLVGLLLARVSRA